ncbi:MAG: cytidylate kinase-like family protein [Lachnospiraceae bacterium]|nr:cytidylate kinase-like family protein [Lachnospiraceae bacterium]
MNRIITIGREFGSGGREMGVRLANELGFDYYDKEIITGIVNHTEYTEGYIREVVEGNVRKILPMTIGRSLDVDVDYHIRQMQDIAKAQTEVIKEMAEKSECVIVGRCADFILEEENEKGNIQLFKLFIHASMESRVRRCMERRTEAEAGMTEKDMEKQIRRIDKERANYYTNYTLRKWGAKENYDICFNTSNMVIKDMIPYIARLF